MTTQKRFESDLAAGDFVSFTFIDEQMIAFLEPHTHGLYSSEGTKDAGFRPFVLTSSGYLAGGIRNLRKLDEVQVLMMLAGTMLRPRNAHLALRAKELFND